MCNSCSVSPRPLLSPHRHEKSQHLASSWNAILWCKWKWSQREVGFLELSIHTRTHGGEGCMKVCISIFFLLHHHHLLMTMLLKVLLTIPGGPSFERSGDLSFITHRVAVGFVIIMKLSSSSTTSSSSSSSSSDVTYLTGVKIVWVHFSQLSQLQLLPHFWTPLDLLSRTTILSTISSCRQQHDDGDDDDLTLSWTWCLVISSPLISQRQSSQPTQISILWVAY